MRQLAAACAEFLAQVSVMTHDKLHTDDDLEYDY
jgi:hypothetical protein